jgi:hypothetical protein
VRKSVIDPATVHSNSRAEQEWFELEEMAKVEVTSEDPSFPVESALVSGKGPGWRAAQRGKQTLRIMFRQANAAPPDQTGVFGDGNCPDPGVHSSVGGRAKRAIQRDSFANSGVSARKARQVK